MYADGKDCYTNNKKQNCDVLKLQHTVTKM
jgi:hypothetical protein